ncbi:cell growth-regulating nucleolar protein isoform X2 [Bacillus rossius redtenbacheri]
MVVFICNNCGESLKKNKVELHGQCSRPLSVSCMDCNKDFNLETYVAHTQCITEQEKYAPKGFVAKPSSNKGLTKQQEWISMVNSIIASTNNLPQDDMALLKVISNYENIPRKKVKFENFIKSGIFRGSKQCVDRVWDLLTKKWNEIKSIKPNVSAASAADKSAANVEEVEIKLPESVSSMDGKGGTKRSKHQRESPNKKVKHEESLTTVENPMAAAIVPDTNISDESKQDKKKKKKKSKGEPASSDLDQSMADVSHTNLNGETKKEKKKKKSGGEAVSSDADQLMADISLADMNGETKKEKKKKSGGEAVSSDADQLTAVITSDTNVNNKTKKHKKKKKSRGASVLSLADQSAASITSDSQTLNTSGSKKFDWQDTILQVLQASDRKELPVKVLRKKVMARYVAEAHLPITDTIKAKFNKRLNKTQGVKALKGRAVLSSTV